VVWRTVADTAFWRYWDGIEGYLLLRDFCHCCECVVDTNLGGWVLLKRMFEGGRAESGEVLMEKSFCTRQKRAPR
jgi:hypothetical protein